MGSDFSIRIYIGGRLYMETVLDHAHDTSKPIQFTAAAPMDRRYSSTGSGLPFPSHTHAFDITPNRGTVENGGIIHLKGMPNSFYINGMKNLIPPTVFLEYTLAKDGTKTHKQCIRLKKTLRGKRLAYSQKEMETGPSRFSIT
jgi:hypothetical protein